MKRIVEVLDRSIQGVTQPFLCRGDDGALYYVKGNFAGHRAKCCEWIAGRLGALLGLPLPQFAIVEVPRVLIQGSDREDIHDLGSGPAFASQRVEGADELRYGFADEWEDYFRQLGATVLLFDWWICNPDRTLGETGGNPNLLWTAADSGLHVIDHNLAFSLQNMDSFWSDHVFASDIWFWDDIQADIMLQMQAAREALPQIWNELPDEWTEIESDLTLDFVSDVLGRVETDADFWQPAGSQLDQSTWPQKNEDDDGLGM